MPAGTNTQSNIGIRRMIFSLATPQWRNFEVNGTQQYKVVQAGTTPYVYAGAVVAQGATIAYDAVAATKYSAATVLEIHFNAGLIDPIN
jgi:hypothetical protein